MALLGNPFKKYVVKQVKKRQEALGQGLGGYPVNDLISINNKSAFLSSTPYIHLASAVKIEKDTEKSISLPGTSVYQSIKASGLLEGIPESDWVGSGLARKFILTGAPNSVDGKRSPSGVVGVDSGNTIPGASGTNTEYPKALIKAYGWGYNNTGVNSGQGYVPPPGVTSVDFEYKNDGALALASINIKAFSKEQFAMIDILYMRPGYTCLLEFGHSVYLDNNGKIVNVDVFQSDPLNYLFEDFEKYALPKSAISMAQRIERAKGLKEGNYEGFFARITKFNWKFNMDGSYDITIKLTGLGDVISSLNTLQPMGNDGKPFSIKSDFVMKAEAKDSDVAADRRKAEREAGTTPARKSSSAKPKGDVKNVYIPAINRALRDKPRGLKTLLTAQAQQEGFRKGFINYDQNNPGNFTRQVGSIPIKGYGTRSTQAKNFVIYNTLEDGIKAQSAQIDIILSGKSTVYKKDATLRDYIYSYAPPEENDTEAYIAFIIGFFQNEGLIIDRRTRLSTIINLA